MCKQHIWKNRNNACDLQKYLGWFHNSLWYLRVIVYETSEWHKYITKVPTFSITAIVRKFLLTTIGDVIIMITMLWNCPFRGHSIITPSLGFILYQSWPANSLTFYLTFTNKNKKRHNFFSFFKSKPHNFFKFFQKQKIYGK